MPSAWIVKPLDVVEHIGPRLVSRPVDLARRALGFERREEALHRGVVPDIARTRQAAHDPVFGHQPLALIARILAAAIGVMQQFTRLATPPQGHRQSVRDEIGCHGRPHRPADDPAREEIEHDGDVEPAFRRPDIREVGSPTAVRTAGRARSLPTLRPVARRHRPAAGAVSALLSWRWPASAAQLRAGCRECPVCCSSDILLACSGHVGRVD